MSWFHEQIRQRAELDQSGVEDTFFRMASVVMDKWSANRLEDKLLIAQEALDDILKYYHQKPIEIPEHIKDTKKQMEYVLRLAGLMARDVILEGDWYRHASGPMLGYLRDAGISVALIPGKLSGYYFKDPTTGKKRRIKKKNANLFSRDAMCFYQPLPMKKLGIRDLLSYMNQSVSRGDLILIVLVTLFAVQVGMLEPKIYDLLTGVVLKTRNRNLLIGAGSFLLCSAFAAQMINMMRTLLVTRINTKTSMAVEASVMMRILSLPVSFFRSFSSGELSSRAESINSLCEMILNNILLFGLGSVMSLLYITQIFRYAPSLVWPSIIIILLTLILTLSASFLQVGISRNKMRLNAEEKGMSFAIINGLQKIRLSGSEKRAFTRWGRLYVKCASLEYNPPTFLKLHSVFITAVSLMGTVVLYNLAIETDVSANQYYAFNAAFGRVSGAFLALAKVAISAASIKPVLEMAEPILQTEPEITLEKQPLPRMNGSIEMSHVSFRYGENLPYILNDLSLKIRSGEYVAIVGRTGCGKSTLVRLLLGFEKPEKGAIYYDRKDLNSLDLSALRRKIGTVMQDANLFQGDIYSNIVISAPELTLDDAWEAAEQAGIAEDIRNMPMGMHTFLSEGQGGISGGQKQRLMIARAIAPKPKILIFDEATSALDNKTQKQVSDALDSMGCTRLVIAHRLSTIQHCDRILVLDGGQIIEDGTYEELIDQGGVFADLVERQRLDSAG
jgi:NHLM bacteriocin system ABC transporter ATP-binding protein